MDRLDELEEQNGRDDEREVRVPGNDACPTGFRPGGHARVCGAFDPSQLADTGDWASRLSDWTDSDEGSAWRCADG
jgi:hypothetical protein